MAFVKLDCGILNSTLWGDRVSREIFITALLMAEPREIATPTPQLEIREPIPTGFVAPPGWYGFVPAAGRGIVRRAHVGDEDGLDALERLGSPDTESRTPEFDGRRLIRVDGGFLVLNFMRYREKDHTAAERQRRLRERRRNGVTAASNTVTSRSRDVTSRMQSTDADAESEARPVGAPCWLAGPGTSVPTGQGEGPRSGTSTEPATPERDPDETGVFDTLGREFSRQVLDPLLRYGAEVGADGVLEFRTGEMHDDQPREIGEPRFPPGDVPGWMAFYVRIV